MEPESGAAGQLGHQYLCTKPTGEAVTERHRSVRLRLALCWAPPEKGNQIPEFKGRWACVIYTAQLLREMLPELDNGGDAGGTGERGG